MIHCSLDSSRKRFDDRHQQVETQRPPRKIPLYLLLRNSLLTYCKIFIQWYKERWYREKQINGSSHLDSWPSRGRSNHNSHRFHVGRCPLTGRVRVGPFAQSAIPALLYCRKRLGFASRLPDYLPTWELIGRSGPQQLSPLDSLAWLIYYCVANLLGGLCCAAQRSSRSGNPRQPG